MSYILDALKHSDRDRHRGEIPDLRTQPLQLVETRDGRPIPYMWAGVVALAVTILAVSSAGIYATLTESSETPTQAAPVRTEVQPIPVAPQANSSMSVPLPITAVEPPLRNDDWLLSADALAEVENVKIRTASARANDMSVASTRYAENAIRDQLTSSSAPPRSTRPTQTASPPPGPTVAKATPASASKPEVVKKLAVSVGALADASPAKPVPAPAQPDPYDGIPHQKQLPVNVQRTIPELNFTVHIFSKTPRSRMVKINGKRLGEGDTIERGLVLEEITKDGVILSINNRRFWRTAR